MSILLEQLTKRYEGIPVVNNVSLEIGDGEFFVLLGSSGSGKTTVLSMIAGLTPVDSGRILLHGRDVTSLPTQQRKVGFVFQNYALFQHMTVAENVEFGLRIRKVKPAERRKKCDELLELVGLAGLGKRMPRQISGGQQQRVALARALASDPEVLLLDEPLGALDAKIRVELRRTLKSIQQQLGIATILVTHDQEEAFNLADRMGVMSFGRLLETGTPEQLYQKPETEFVATFLGSANLLVGQASSDGIHLGSLKFPLPREARPRASEQERVQVLFRPEDVTLAASPDTLGRICLGRGEIEEVSFGGSYERIRLRLPTLPGVRPISPPVAFGSNSFLIDAIRSPDQAEQFPLSKGDTAWIGIRRIHTLTHAGLTLLIVTDGSLRAQAALALGGQIARMAHGRVMLLGCDRDPDSLKTHLQEARKQLGSGLAALEVRISRRSIVEAVSQLIEQQHFDLVVMGFQPQEDLNLAERILACGNHNLLLVPGPQPVPSKALISVAYGEPGKEDVRFAGRLMAHLGAEATLLSVIQPETVNGNQKERAERFLAKGTKTLELLNVPAKYTVRAGAVADEILAELNTGKYDLLVVGAPLARRDGRVSFEGIVGRMVSRITDRPVLIVRSRFLLDKVRISSYKERMLMYKE